VTRNLTSENLARTDQITAYLAAQAPLPVSTGQILDTLGLRGYDGTVNRLLNRLAKRGEIEKWPASEDHRSCYWRWWAAADTTQGEIDFEAGA
jgi:hypothetical protein